jgi:hypothetical protein
MAAEERPMPEDLRGDLANAMFAAAGTAPDGGWVARAQDLEAWSDPERRLELIESTFQWLGERASLPMLDSGVNAIVGRFPGWSYERRETQGRERYTYFLRRNLREVIAVDELPAWPENPTRRTYLRSRPQLGLVIASHLFKAPDLQHMLLVEDWLWTAGALDVETDIPKPRRGGRPKVSKAEKPAPPQPEPFVAVPFAKNLDPDRAPSHPELFTADQEEILRELVKHGNATNAAKHLGKHPGQVSQIMKPVKEMLAPLGAKVHNNTDLAVIAVALGIGDIADVPRGATEKLKVSQRAVLRKFFDLQLEKRAAARTRHNKSIMGQIRARLGLTTVHEAVMRGVQDGVIELPTVAEIYEAAGKELPRLQ